MTYGTSPVESGELRTVIKDDMLNESDEEQKPF